MLILDVKKIAKNFEYEQLFEDVSFTLNEGESIAIVGPNGCGKSIILKIIAGLITPDKSIVNIKKDAKLAYLDQLRTNIDVGKTVYKILKTAFTKINVIEKKVKRIWTKSKYRVWWEKFSLMGDYEIDLKRIEWLEEYIKSFKGVSIIVSHDRYFLDKIANQILAIDDNEIRKVYVTNYLGYLLQRAVEFKKQMAQYGDEQEKIKQLEAKAKQFMNLGMSRNSSTLTKQGKMLLQRAKRIQLKNCCLKENIYIYFLEENKSSKK